MTAIRAPSATSLLNMFGNLKATKKASETGPAPIAAARKISLQNQILY